MRRAQTLRLVGFVILFFFPLFSFARSKLPEKLQAPKIGNFALPGSQQVFPLISFGQAIIGQNVLLLDAPLNATFSTQNTYSIKTGFEALWGVTDRLSLFASVPFAIQNRSGENHSSGFQDMKFEFEGAIYENGDPTHVVMWTLVGNVTAPTGSVSKNPTTGLGAPSFFAGTTFSYMDTEWYAFTSYAGIFPLAGRHFQGGNQFLYQIGFGLNIPTHPKLIFDGLVEFDGTYSWKDKTHGVSNPNSGSNVIYVTPSLYLASRYWIFQLGAGYPFVQQVNGNQPKQYLNVSFVITYTIG